MLYFLHSLQILLEFETIRYILFQRLFQTYREPTTLFPKHTMLEYCGKSY